MTYNLRLIKVFGRYYRYLNYLIFFKSHGKKYENDAVIFYNIYRTYFYKHSLDIWKIYSVNYKEKYY